MIVALLGQHQSGKSESTPVFRDEGFHFRSLNGIGNDLRAVWSPHHNYFWSLVPGCFTQEGTRLATYYQAIARDPSLFERLTDLEFKKVREEIRRIASETSEDELLIVSWEYLYLMLDELKPDHILFFKSNHAVWCERIRGRAKALQ